MSRSIPPLRELEETDRSRMSPLATSVLAPLFILRPPPPPPPRRPLPSAEVAPPRNSTEPPGRSAMVDPALMFRAPAPAVGLSPAATVKEPPIPPLSPRTPKIRSPALFEARPTFATSSPLVRMASAVPNATLPVAMGPSGVVMVMDPVDPKGLDPASNVKLPPCKTGSRVKPAPKQTSPPPESSPRPHPDAIETFPE